MATPAEQITEEVRKALTDDNQSERIMKIVTMTNGVKSFYDRDHRYTQEGNALADELHAAIKPIFDRWIKIGYGPREVAHQVSLTGFDIEMESVL